MQLICSKPVQSWAAVLIYFNYFIDLHVYYYYDLFYICIYAIDYSKRVESWAVPI
jgi:hypothetical protein